MMMLWSAVNRISRAGAEVGISQSITPYEGLQTMTLYVAEQFDEADVKGSLEVGKLADLVILDKDPLKVPATEIKDIAIVETLKEGVSVYKNN
jgi:hypothetical protein